jgi:hypothetical protein
MLLGPVLLLLVRVAGVGAAGRSSHFLPLVNAVLLLAEYVKGCTDLEA